MHIEDIFAIDDSDGLYAIKWEHDEEHAFNHFFEQMNNAVFLHDFFEENMADIKRNGYSTINEAVRKAKKDATKLEQELLDASENGKLHDYFKPLSKNEILKRANLNRAKCYGVIENSFLRIYAVKIEAIGSVQYLITGGIIKLTQKMQDREHTRRELDKMNAVINFLINEGVFELPL